MKLGTVLETEVHYGPGDRVLYYDVQSGDTKFGFDVYLARNGKTYYTPEQARELALINLRINLAQRGLTWDDLEEIAVMEHGVRSEHISNG